MQIRKIKYRPVSILSSLSKIYEKLMSNNILFPSKCGVKKGYGAQH